MLNNWKAVQTYLHTNSVPNRPTVLSYFGRSKVNYFTDDLSIVCGDSLNWLVHFAFWKSFPDHLLLSFAN